MRLHIWVVLVVGHNCLRLWLILEYLNWRLLKLLRMDLRRLESVECQLLCNLIAHNLRIDWLHIVLRSVICSSLYYKRLFIIQRSADRLQLWLDLSAERRVGISQVRNTLHRLLVRRCLRLNRLVLVQQRLIGVHHCRHHISWHQCWLIRDLQSILIIPLARCICWLTFEIIESMMLPRMDVHVLIDFPRFLIRWRDAAADHGRRVLIVTALSTAVASLRACIVTLQQITPCSLLIALELLECPVE